MASEAGSTADIEPDVCLRNWFTAYINKVEDLEKQNLDFFEAKIPDTAYIDKLEDLDKQNLDSFEAHACRDRIPDEMLREYGDLRSVL